MSKDADFVQQLRQEFPGFRVIESSLVPLSAMTLANRIYVKPGWTSQPWQFRYVLLRHERIHMFQQRSLGLGSIWLGMVLFYLLYGLILPAGLAYFRWRWEKEAYVESLRAWRDVGDPLEEHADFYIKSISGLSYGWAWPRSWVRGFFDQAVAAIKRSGAR